MDRLEEVGEFSLADGEFGAMHVFERVAEMNQHQVALVADV